MMKLPGNPADQQRASGAAPSLLARLEVFFGEVHPAAARVYASLQTDDLPRNCALSGSIRGPFCRYASTLQSSASLVSRSHNGGLLAEAVLPDPCFWTPDLPHLYRVQVELAAGQRRPVMCSFNRSPVPRPRKKRPGMSAAMVAAAWAIETGCVRWSAVDTPVPTRSSHVEAAMAPSTDQTNGLSPWAATQGA